MASKDEQAGGGGGGGGGDEGEGKEDSDMEGWEDDGWGTFDNSAPPAPPPQQSKAPQEISSGADFFDSIETSSSSQRTQAKDPFEDFGFAKAQSSRNAQKDHAPTRLTSASLFGDKDTSSKSGGGGVAASNGDSGGGGWGDWSSDFDMKPTVKV